MLLLWKLHKKRGSWWLKVLREVTSVQKRGWKGFSSFAPVLVREFSSHSFLINDNVIIKNERNIPFGPKFSGRTEDKGVHYFNKCLVILVICPFSCWYCYPWHGMHKGWMNVCLPFLNDSNNSCEMAPRRMPHRSGRLRWLMIAVETGLS